MPPLFERLPTATLKLAKTSDPSLRPPSRRIFIVFDASMVHNSIMRTTVDLPDHLLIQAKGYAAEQRMSLTAVVADSLRLFLSTTQRRATRTEIPQLPIIHAAKVVKGVDLTDTSALLELQ